MAFPGSNDRDALAVSCPDSETLVANDKDDLAVIAAMCVESAELRSQRVRLASVATPNLRATTADAGRDRRGRNYLQELGGTGTDRQGSRLAE